MARPDKLLDVARLTQKLRTDPGIARRLAARMNEFPPELRTRIAAGDPEAIMEAIRTPPSRAARQTPRQLELPLGDAPATTAPPASTAMIPFGVRGPGVPVGSNALTPENLADRLQGPLSLYRPQTSMGRPRLLGLPDKRLSTDVDLPGLGGPRPRVQQAMPEGPVPRIEARPPARITGPVDDTAEQLGRIAQQRAAEQTARAAERAAQESIGSQFDRAMRRALNDPAAPVAIGAGFGTGIGAALSLRPQPIPSAPEATDIVAEPDEAPALEDTGGTADLAAEASPPPEVADPEPEPRPVRRHLIGRTTEAPPADYSMQARQLIDQLNAMRRAAGGEVPEARAMQAEINRLLELGNQTRRATFVAAPGDDASRYFQQAQGIIDQLNAAYREGSLTPNSPRAREMMAQVRQLQQAGDNLRNRRAG